MDGFLCKKRFLLFVISHPHTCLQSFQLCELNNNYKPVKTLLSRLDFAYVYVLLGEATLGLTFLLYIILARVLGPEQYEIFAVAVALGAILSLFIQFGLPTVLTREVAANPRSGPKSTVKFLIMEGFHFLPVLLLLLPIAWMLGYEGDDLLVCYLVMFAELGRSAKMTLRGVLRGLGWFSLETVSVALERFFAIALSGVVLFLSRNLVWVVGTLAFVRLLDILGLLFYLSRKVRIWSPLHLGGFLQSLRMAFPFALSGALGILYYQVDILILKAIAVPGEAGFYSAAYRILEIFFTLPRVVFHVTFTRFARCHATDPEMLPQEIYKSIRLLLAVVLPALVAAGLLQTTLVKVIYGDAFAPSVKSLAILLPSLSVRMFATLVENFLQTTGREKYLPPLFLGATITNVTSNFILIPFLGAVGAAFATLFSEVVLCTIGLSLMIRMGYEQVGQRIGVIAAISLLATSLPSLIMNGLTPIVAIALMVPSIAAIIVLMRRDRFLRQTH